MGLRITLIHHYYRGFRVQFTRFAYINAISRTAGVIDGYPGNRHGTAHHESCMRRDKVKIGFIEFPSLSDL